MLIPMIVTMVVVAGAAATVYARSQKSVPEREKGSGRELEGVTTRADLSRQPQDHPSSVDRGDRRQHTSGQLISRESHASDPAREAAPAREDLAQVQEHQRDPAEQGAPAREDLAQTLDLQRAPTTCTSATPRGSPPVALVHLHQRDPVIYRWSLDGNTSWRLDAPPTGFSILPTLERALAARRKALELYDPRGRPIPVNLRREGRRVVVQTGAIRIDVRPTVAEIAITATAVETEGPVAWYLRELPRAVWWLLGVDVSVSICPACIGRQPPGCERCDRGRRPWASWRELADELARNGLEQHRIEQCLDLGGLPIVPGLEDALVTDGLMVKPWIPRPGARNGVEIGNRRNPQMMLIYDKPNEIRATQADHAALFEQMRAAGWRSGDTWTRIDLRTQGPALVLLQDGEVILDARHPGAALDDATRAALWRHGLNRIWLADTRCGHGRARDKDRSPLWDQLRDVVAPVFDEGAAKTVMISRAAERELESVAAAAADRLGKSAIDVGVLRGGRTLDEVAELARTELDEQLRPALARERLLASRARYQALLDAVEQQATEALEPKQDQNR